MIDFMQQQIEASERLIKAMSEDHKERMYALQVWAETVNSLQKKLNERDAEIEELRLKLKNVDR